MTKLILIIIDKFIGFLPLRSLLAIGSAIGTFVYWIDLKHRRRAIGNIKRVFGNEKSEKEIKKIAKESFQNLATNMLEFVKGTVGDVEFIGIDEARKVLNEHKKVIYTLGHLGNWEVMGRMAIKKFEIELVSVGKHMKNRAFDEFVSRKRTEGGLEIIWKKNALRQIVKELKNDKSVAILMDQYAGRDALFVDFLGIPSSTTSSPAVLSLRMNIPILPVFMIRKSRGQYKMIVEKPISIEKTGDVKKDVFATMQECSKVLEHYIRQYPQQWLWSHRRWR